MAFAIPALAPALAAIGGALLEAAPAISAVASVATSVVGTVQAKKAADQQASQAKRQTAALLSQRQSTGLLGGNRGIGSTLQTAGGAQGDLNIAPTGKRTLLGG